MVTRILPVILMAMLPFDLLSGVAVKGAFPTQATLAALVGSGLGLYLARRLWRGAPGPLEKLARLQVVSEQGPLFDPQSEEALIRLDNARVNFSLGAGLMAFGVFLTLIFIASNLVTVPVQANLTLISQAVQIAVMLLFNLLVAVIELFGAKIFLRR